MKVFNNIEIAYFKICLSMCSLCMFVVPLKWYDLTIRTKRSIFLGSISFVHVNDLLTQQPVTSAIVMFEIDPRYDRALFLHIGTLKMCFSLEFLTSRSNCVIGSFQ